MPVVVPLVAAAGGALVSHVLNRGSQNKADNANQAAADAAQTQREISLDQWNTYKDIYQPLERKYVEDAQNYDTPAAYDRAAGEASATVAEQYGKARDRLSRTPGLDPSSAAYTASMAGLDNSQAAADAVSQNAARNKVRDMAWARRTDALSLGKGLPAQASAGLAQTAQIQAGLANSQQAQVNANGAAIGRLVSQGVNAWQRSQTPGLSSFTMDPTVPTDANGEFQFDP